jgi:hypothetical protein
MKYAHAKVSEAVKASKNYGGYLLFSFQNATQKIGCTAVFLKPEVVGTTSPAPLTWKLSVLLSGMNRGSADLPSSDIEQQNQCKP